MSCREMIEWEQYIKDDPFEEERADVRHALWVSMYHSAHSKKPMDAEKFLPKWTTDDNILPTPRKRSAEDLKVLLQQAMKLGEKQWERETKHGSR